MGKSKQKKMLWIAVGLSVCCLWCGFHLISDVSADEVEADSIIIQVDTHSYSADNLPNGIEGKTYPIFSATATDALGRVVDNIETLVYAPDGKLLPMVDGRFETKIEGEYSIFYTATSGAYTAQQTLKVMVTDEDSYKAPYLKLKEAVSEANTGEQIFLPQSEYGNGVGVLDLMVSVEYLGPYQCGNPKVLDFDGAQYFIPEAEGEYVVIHTLTDLVGTVVTEKTFISVEDLFRPIMEEPSVPKLAHVEETISFPVVDAKIYYNGALIYVPVKVYVNDKDVTETMSYQPTEAKEYTVKYVAENIFGGENVSCEYSLQVVEASSDAFVDDYLYLNGFISSYRETEVDGLEGMVYLLTADGSKEYAEMEFKTPLHEQYLSVELGVETEYSNFKELYVTFTDSENAGEQIEIKLVENEKKLVEMYVNDKYVTTLDKSFTTQSQSYANSTLQFMFNSETNEIVDGSNMNVLTMVEYTADGKPFEGFSSGKAYLSVKTEGIESESRIKLYRIAGMLISNLNTDRGAPLYITRNDFADSFRADINDTVCVKKLEAFDLFEGTAVVTTKITSPSGAMIFEGELLEDYYFTATEYGIYNIKYMAYDSARNVKEKGAVVDIVDRIPPVIIAPELPCTVKLGTEYTFDIATVTDNVTEKCTTWISVTNENYGKPQVLGNKYTFTEEGTYVVTYGATDATGNMTVVEYTIICVKGDR